MKGTVAMQESLHKIAKDSEEELKKALLPVGLTKCIHSVVFFYHFSSRITHIGN